MKPVSHHEVVEAMARYGGSFARAISEAFSRADPENERRLRAAFPELYDEYYQMAQLRKERAANA